MATRRKTNKKPGRGGRIALGVFAALILALVVTAAAGLVNGVTVETIATAPHIIICGIQK